MCKQNKTLPWTQEDSEKVLKCMKKDKCRDPNGLNSEMFATKIPGKDLTVSLLMLFNGINASEQFLTFMKV